MKKNFAVLPLLFIFFASTAVNAQVSYSFTALSRAYTPIAGGTVPDLINPYLGRYQTPDEGFANGVPIGFTFIYNGIPYDSININVNGFVSLGEGFKEDPSENYYVNYLKAGPFSQPSVRPLIAPLWSDLDIINDNNLSYVLTGAGPNRVFTVQWANAYWDYMASGPVISFQLKLYETTNVIEFAYRRGAEAPSSVASIGLTGGGVGPENFMSLTNSSAAPGISTTDDSEIDTQPATNQVYRFTPLACTAPSITRLSAITPTSVTFSWNPVAGATGYEYASSTSATPPASGTATLADTGKLTGLNTGANNYFFVRTSCGGGVFSAWSVKALVACAANILPADGAIVSRPPVISWNPVAGADGYSVMWSTNGIDYADIGYVEDSTTSATITQLSHDSTYYFYIRPFIKGDTASTSCQSNATSFTINPAPVIPCVTNILPADGATGINIPTPISFNGVADATGYFVMISSDGIKYDTLGIASDTSVALPSLQFGTTYHYYIMPIIGEDTATIACQSNATAFTTRPAPPVPVNDSCGAAINITAVDGVVNGTTFSSTPSPGAEICPEPIGIPESNPDDDVWYKFTARDTGQVTITVTGGVYFDAVVSVYRGDCDSLVLLDCSDNTGDEDVETLIINDLDSAETYYIRVYDYSAASPGDFTISIIGNALPVTMGELEGKRSGSENILSWITQTELNNKGFEVQRSANGRDFNKLDFVASKSLNGNSSSVLHYSYTDFNPIPGNSFYRLKQSDKDGKSAYSNIILVKGADATRLQMANLYPNPSKSVLNMVIGSPSSNKINLVITDLAGKIVLQQSAPLIGGSNNVKINIAKLSSGSYLIKAICTNGCGTAVRKFVKQ